MIVSANVLTENAGLLSRQPLPVRDPWWSQDNMRQMVQDGTLQQHLCPTDAVFSALPAVTLTEEGEKRAKNGAHLTGQHCTDGVVPPLGESCRVYGPDGAFLMTGVAKELDKGGAGIFCGATFWYKES